MGPVTRLSLRWLIILEPETEERKVKPAVIQPGKRKRRSNSVGRVGDQIKRPSGTGYAAVFVRPFLIRSRIAAKAHRQEG